MLTSDNILEFNANGIPAMRKLRVGECAISCCGGLVDYCVS